MRPTHASGVSARRGDGAASDVDFKVTAPPGMDGAEHARGAIAHRLDGAARTDGDGDVARPTGTRGKHTDETALYTDDIGLRDDGCGLKGHGDVAL